MDLLLSAIASERLAIIHVAQSLRYSLLLKLGIQDYQIMSAGVCRIQGDGSES
jgi:hypothetical protein